ncbi:flagellar assembly protein FliH [Thiopseudomonas alkaliphila]|uniref:flagellar assembly protein FliH n=1 Tax=Thiopseudomonas alkaliphila TaxID=1697053 RepID=UPI0035712EEF
MFKPHQPNKPEHLHETPQDEHWQPWEMEQLRTQRLTQAPVKTLNATEHAQQQSFRRNAELEALREQARAAAHAQGYQAGLEQGQQEGYQQGLEQGRAEALAAGEQAAEQALAPLLTLAENFTAALTQFDKEVAHALVELALSTGRQLAGEALTQQPKQILNLVRELLHTEPALNTAPRLWLHPQDLALVEQHLSAELTAAGWQLQPDEQLTRGGCRVTSVSGELDATWESRWQAIQQQVLTPPPSSAK